MKIYFTAPQNTPYQKAFVDDCAARMRQAGFDVTISSDAYIHHQPAFEVSAEVDGKAINSDENKTGRQAKSPFAREVFRENYTKLAEANLLVALLDGSQVDDRVACEIGLFYSLSLKDASKKAILGFASDARCLRRSDSSYGVNIFTLGTLEEIGKVAGDFEQVLTELTKLT